MNNYASNPNPGGSRTAPQAGGLKGKFFSQITIHLSLLRLMMIVLVMILLLVWAFFIGVLMGRGETPEDAVPEIASMMPTANSTVSESAALVANMLEKGTGHNNNTNANPAQTKMDKQVQTSTAQPAHPRDGIIQAENLGLMDGMKNKPNRDDLTNEPLSTSIPPQKEKPQASDKKNKPKEQDKKNQADQDKQAKDKAQTKDQAKDKSGSSGQFDYVYQVAASTDAAAAEKLKKQIEGLGVSASVQSGEKDGKTLYRIQVSYRGRPDQISGLRQKLSKVGIGQIILKTKIPVQ